MASPDEKPEIAEASEVSKVASNPAPESEPKDERVCESNPESKSKKVTPDPQQASFLLIWKNIWASFLLNWEKIFLASCVFAVLLDPLFLYIPMIDQDKSCFRVDNNLKITTLVLRSLTDLFYIMDIAFQFYESESSSSFIKKCRQKSRSSQYLKDLLAAIAKTIWKSRVLIDILAILPLPQVAILSFFSKMRVSSSLNVSKVIMNLVVLMQYLPRVLRIYLSCIDLRKTPNGGTGDISIWVKGVLNFFMYILASHVLGAVWYFFAIQRMTDCWQNACESGNGTVCDHIHDFSCVNASQPPLAFPNASYCTPVDKPDKSQFDFGIFANLLGSEITKSTNHPQKFSTCFCWGLRNLSSLASNLAPSINTWENLFVTFISIIGLLLFIYLIGNLQTYMQFDLARKEERRRKKRDEQKMKKKWADIKLWLSKHGIPEKMIEHSELEIKNKVEQELEEDRDVNLENNTKCSIIPSDLQDHINKFSPLARLKQAPALHDKDGIVSDEIFELLKAVKYTDKEDIISEDKPLEKMLFIVDGDVIVEKRNSSGGSKRGRGELYGEKLLTWPSYPSFPREKPSATVSVKAIGDVEALFLEASDMENVGFKYRSHFKFGKVVEQLANSPTPPRILTRQELEKATDRNFYDDAKNGEEGAGSTVYKGTLTDGKVVAIKVPSSSITSSQTTQSHKFMNEVIVLSQTFHRNVVRLFGVCLEEQRPPIVVYEFAGNGTLDEHIHKKNDRGPLLFDLRLDIAVDVARGLEYLHNLPSMRIVHRDVKSSNVLLDDDWTAKVSDFTASRFVSEDKDEVLKLVKDTLGYTPPEYHESNTLTDKGDVYCFGVVLIELMTGQTKEEMKLTEYSVSSVKGRSLDEIIDQEIVNQRNSEIVKEMADLAVRCIKLKGEERPTMKEVFKKLEELKTMLTANFTPSPKQTE